MQIVIVGFGKMGKVLYEKSLAGGHSVAAIIDPHDNSPLVSSRECSLESLSGGEVVIEFSTPEGVLERLALYSQAQIPAVIATTGWYGELAKGGEIVEEGGGKVIWSGNFAIGVHLFFRLARYGAQMINQVGLYDPVVQELFHSAKGDSPSGTSEMLGKILLEELEGKSKVESGRLDRPRGEDEIHLASARGGFHPGTHTLIFDSPADTLEITHRARSRDGYATGALKAAEWIVKQGAGFYSIDQMLDETLASGEGR